jgi:hypothetical protein
MLHEFIYRKFRTVVALTRKGQIESSKSYHEQKLLTFKGSKGHYDFALLFIPEKTLNYSGEEMLA